MPVCAGQSQDEQDPIHFSAVKSPLRRTLQGRCPWDPLRGRPRSIPLLPNHNGSGDRVARMVTVTQKASVAARVSCVSVAMTFLCL